MRKPCGANHGLKGSGGGGGTATGGGMSINDAQANLTDSWFGDPSLPNSGNRAIGGSSGNGPTLGYAGRSYGGGLDNEGTLLSGDNVFFGNLAEGGVGNSAGNYNNGGGVGGGVYNGLRGRLTAIFDNFESNTAQGRASSNGSGGGLANGGGIVVADMLQFLNNRALETDGTQGWGGAIHTFNGAFSLTNSYGNNDFGFGTIGVPGNGPLLQGIYSNGTNWTGSGNNTVA